MNSEKFSLSLGRSWTEPPSSKVTVWQQAIHKSGAPLKVQFDSFVEENLGQSFQQPLESEWDGLWASGLLFC